MPSADTNPSAPRDAQTFSSSLKEGRDRFLAHAIDHSLTSGRRTAEDFIRHFPPRAIMKGLEHQASLRASILVLTTGIKQKIALKKDWEDAATDLQIALEERETDAESIVELFGADDRVRYLDPQKIWLFLTEGEFWKMTSDRALSDLAKSHVAFLLERALTDKLLTHRDIVEGATVSELSNRLPKSELGRLITCALANAERGKTFTEVDLLATTPPSVLVEHLSLAHLWDTVVVPKIAERHGYALKPSAAIAKPEDAPKAAEPAGTPKTDTAEAPRAEAPKADAPKADAPKADAPKADAPKADAPKAEPAKSALPELPPVPVSKGVPPAKESSKVKLKQPEPPAKAGTDSWDEGPTVAKTAGSFGSDDDDIEVIEDDAQAV